ncbi:hypothetical protein K461DRAFT_314256 [Myriangium duriaei CBS 260.36]|uniref:Uncharacterized protein n=1 Tax=Myriangium duriaei CBS 260.36 TaxID=1168546 RepID=A0A9P4J2W8_9PEZI|nr:hypothetical protein K461DRAFT_314256 [Myriangium duriaei CBS 260.36]
MATPEKWPRRSSVTRSPDTVSPLWPDRPIRPMPKNRLRSTLSPEQADSIVYPPHPPQTSPLFSFPYGLSEAQDGRTGARMNGHRHGSPTHCDCGGYHPDNSDEDEAGYDHPSYRWSSPGPDGAAVSSVQQKLLASRTAGKAPPPPASTASSADGYESFENTSNKKKRKIPLSSGSSAHQSSLSTELANMGISSPPPPESHVNGSVSGSQAGQYPTATGAGSSGAGRGRFSRHGSKIERRAGSASTLLNGYSSSLSAKSRGGDFRGDGTKSQHEGDQGIISAAIADAAGQRPVTPPDGKENVSLLSQQPDKSTTPKSQFTFTCETDTSSKIVWPLQGTGPYNTPPKKNYYPIRQRPADPPNTNHATQTTPSLRGSSDPRMAAPPSPPPVQNAPAQQNGQAPPPKPRRRRPSKEFALAARQRRLAQEFNNYQNKPHKDSMWICEFCEYEDIYGYPPRALIRQYEIKDRAERQKAEERRRLLEKAKMKKNKGKNKGKGTKNANAQPPANAGQPYDQGLDNVNMPPDVQGDEYYDDEYDDGYDPVDPNDPAYAQGYHYPPHPGDLAPPGVPGHVPQAQAPAAVQAQAPPT